MRQGNWISDQCQRKTQTPLQNTPGPTVGAIPRLTLECKLKQGTKWPLFQSIRTIHWHRQALGCEPQGKVQPLGVHRLPEVRVDPLQLIHLGPHGGKLPFQPLVVGVGHRLAGLWRCGGGIATSFTYTQGSGNEKVLSFRWPGGIRKRHFIHLRNMENHSIKAPAYGIHSG